MKYCGGSYQIDRNPIGPDGTRRPARTGNNWLKNQNNFARYSANHSASLRKKSIKSKTVVLKGRQTLWQKAMKAFGFGKNEDEEGEI